MFTHFYNPSPEQLKAWAPMEVEPLPLQSFLMRSRKAIRHRMKALRLPEGALASWSLGRLRSWQHCQRMQRQALASQARRAGVLAPYDHRAA